MLTSLCPMLSATPPELEVTAGHWPFADQIAEMTFISKCPFARTQDELSYFSSPGPPFKKKKASPSTASLPQVDVLVTTAGGIEEDFIKCLADTYIGDFNLQGSQLRKRGLNRIGNLIAPNDNYIKFEDWVMPILDAMLEEQQNQVRRGGRRAGRGVHRRVRRGQRGVPHGTQGEGSPFWHSVGGTGEGGTREGGGGGRGRV